MGKKYYEEIKERLIRDSIRTNDMAKEKDKDRNRIDYGCCVAWVTVLWDMGHDVRVHVWKNDDGFLEIKGINIEDEDNYIEL